MYSNRIIGHNSSYNNTPIRQSKNDIFYENVKVKESWVKFDKYIKKDGIFDL